MKRQIEEKIIAFAYGELDATEQAQIRELIASSPEAKKVYDEYVLTSVATGQLPLAPPASLNAERLQQAILSRKLSQPSSKLGWIGVLTTAAAALVVFTVVSQRGNLPSEDQRDIDSPITVGTTADSTTQKSPIAPEGGFALPDDPEVSKPTPQSKPSGRVFSTRRSSIAPTELHAANSGALENAGVATEPAAKTSLAGSGGVAPDAGMVADKGFDELAPKDEPIVLISSNDGETDGTSRATEARESNNVSIGG
ncbi:MAG: hypothetical protein U0R49_08175 [Fimbriimonadales bacterium]